MKILKNLRFLWHILLMIIISILLLFGIFLWMDNYTRHGQFVSVPHVRGLSLQSATKLLQSKGLKCEVSDSVFAKDIPPGTVFESIPEEDTKVKPQRIIFLKINALSPRMVEIPPTLEGMSLRQARATLQGLGFVIEGVTEVGGNFDGLVIGLENLVGDSIRFGEHLAEGAPLILHVTSIKAKKLMQDSIALTEESVENNFLEEPISKEEETPDNTEEENWW